MTSLRETTVEQHLDAIRSREPTVRALVGFQEQDARQRAARAATGPLGGWALGVKDIIDVQGLPTRAGTTFLPYTPATRNADVVTRLESLGAFVLAKTVTTALAYFDPGPTTNPHDRAHTPGGSSMGSAAAVAAGMVRASLGTQTIGSIARPAAFCGVVGYKPTYERISREGVLPFSPSVDTVGFFTAGTGDMCLLAEAYFQEPLAAAAASPKVGVVTDLLCAPASEPMLTAVQQLASQLAAQGWSVRPAELPGPLHQAYENHVQLIAAELAIAQRDLFARHQDQYPPRAAALLREGQQISEQQRRALLDQQAAARRLLDAMFERFDLLLTPSAPGSAPRDLSTTGDPRMSLLMTHTGVPTLTLPLRVPTTSLPLGVQLVAPRNADAALLTAARAVEMAVSAQRRA